MLEHLDAVRALQDETGGFTAFVPWSYKPGNTPLEKWIKHYAGPTPTCRMLAVARCYLDNFDHVQASWFSEGKKTGQIALHFGADDFGGTLFEENVHLATGHVNKTTVDEIATLIRESGLPARPADHALRAGQSLPATRRAGELVSARHRAPTSLLAGC